MQNHPNTLTEPTFSDGAEAKSMRYMHRISREDYERYEAEFLAATEALREKGEDDAMGSMWAERWRHRAAQIWALVMQHGVCREDGDEQTVNVGLTPEEAADALFICGMGASELVGLGGREPQGAIVGGFDELRELTELRSEVENTMRRNSVLAAWRTHVGEDVSKAQVRGEWVRRYAENGATEAAFDTIHKQLRNEQKLVINLKRVFWVAEPEEVDVAVTNLYEGGGQRLARIAMGAPMDDLFGAGDILADGILGSLTPAVPESVGDLPAAGEAEDAPVHDDMRDSPSEISKQEAGQATQGSERGHMPEQVPQEGAGKSPRSVLDRLEAVREAFPPEQ